MLRYDQEKRFDSEIMLVLKPEDETVDMIEYEAKMIGKKFMRWLVILNLIFILEIVWQSIKMLLF